MAERPTMAELRDRLAACAQHYGGFMPRDAALAWDGYFAALLEWGLISPAEHAELLRLTPRVEGSPVLGILLGWNDRPAQGPPG